MVIGGEGVDGGAGRKEGGGFGGCGVAVVIVAKHFGGEEQGGGAGVGEGAVVEFEEDGAHGIVEGGDVGDVVERAVAHGGVGKIPVDVGIEDGGGGGVEDAELVAGGADQLGGGEGLERPGGIIELAFVDGVGEEGDMGFDGAEEVGVESGIGEGAEKRLGEGQGVGSEGKIEREALGRGGGTNTHVGGGKMSVIGVPAIEERGEGEDIENSVIDGGPVVAVAGTLAKGIKTVDKLVGVGEVVRLCNLLAIGQKLARPGDGRASDGTFEIGEGGSEPREEGVHLDNGSEGGTVGASVVGPGNASEERLDFFIGNRTRGERVEEGDDGVLVVRDRAAAPGIGGVGDVGGAEFAVELIEATIGFEAPEEAGNEEQCGGEEEDEKGAAEADGGVAAHGGIVSDAGTAWMKRSDSRRMADGA